VKFSLDWPAKGPVQRMRDNLHDAGRGGRCDGGLGVRFVWAGHWARQPCGSPRRGGGGGSFGKTLVAGGRGVRRSVSSRCNSPEAPQETGIYTLSAAHTGSRSRSARRRLTHLLPGGGRNHRGRRAVQSERSKLHRAARSPGADQERASAVGFHMLATSATSP